MKTLIRIEGFPAEVRAEIHPNTNLDRCLYTTLFICLLLRTSFFIGVIIVIKFKILLLTRNHLKNTNTFDQI
jgi:hypothetical protein